ncbi:flavin-containing monooxygenase [Aspergillus homomorphus CBS 101889]|uniref:L-ornithine N(5)-monooxygenase n=1 Tax=Aspergillus homomorphus (strain CBS 101889) TaxID=1450537 RepID=A0A395IB92_ASPHC|nr:monooxygenase [Aspergillus homomorphus CBS 101889]RAL17316.1 monooxygenase [Aspergillus homomorphus CBS 101889]
MAANEHRFCLILGAGYGGIVQACTLLRRGILSSHDLEIIDRNGGFGGVWWKNTYPGAACDIAAEVYTISWALNPYWTRRLPSQPEIQHYLEKVALDHRLDECTTFNTEVVDAAWDEQQLLWTVRTKDVRGTKAWTCNLLISATGQYSTPRKPDIPGIDTFKGRQWHTSDWPKDNDADLKGKRVGIIGAGPSAAQLIPHIADDVGRLFVYKRGSSFCVPRWDPETSRLRRWLFAMVPALARWSRCWASRITRYIHWNVTQEGSWWQKAVVAIAHFHLNRQVRDEQLREKLRAKDKFGCKHVLVLSDYYPVLNEEHVELITDPAVALDEYGIVSRNEETSREERREVDVLIWATGYKAEEFGAAVPTRGRGGRLLSEKYGSDMCSLYGLAVDEFPNYFNLLGPNSIGFDIHIVELFELQAEYIAQIAQYLHRRQTEKQDHGRRYAVMAKGERLREWSFSLREGQAKHPAADPACRSHYKSKDGQVFFYPYGYAQYKKLVRQVDFGRDWLLLSRISDNPVTAIAEIPLSDRS